MGSYAAHLNTLRLTANLIRCPYEQCTHHRHSSKDDCPTDRDQGSPRRRRRKGRVFTRSSEEVCRKEVGDGNTSKEEGGQKNGLAGGRVAGQVPGHPSGEGSQRRLELLALHFAWNDLLSPTTTPVVRGKFQNVAFVMSYAADAEGGKPEI